MQQTAGTLLEQIFDPAPITSFDRVEQLTVVLAIFGRKLLRGRTLTQASGKVGARILRSLGKGRCRCRDQT